MDNLTIAIFLATVNKAIMDYIAAPLKQRFPDVDFWFLIYVELVTGGLIGWFSGIDLFASLVPGMTPLLGQLLTAVVIGGGSGLIYKLFGNGSRE